MTRLEPGCEGSDAYFLANGISGFEGSDAGFLTVTSEALQQFRPGCKGGCCGKMSSRELRNGRECMANRKLYESALPLSFFACSASAEITYSRDVAPILYQKCTGCHHPNDLAPMSLIDYKSVRPWAKAIREAVLLKRMPPWFADSPSGHFSNDPSLTESETHIITEWVDQGAKEGNPRDVPPVPSYVDGWHIGKPDVVFDIGEDHVVKNTVVDEYIYFTVPTNFTEGHWVQAVELRPGN